MLNRSRDYFWPYHLLTGHSNKGKQQKLTTTRLCDFYTSCLHRDPFYPEGKPRPWIISSLLSLHARYCACTPTPVLFLEHTEHTTALGLCTSHLWSTLSQILQIFAHMSAYQRSLLYSEMTRALHPSLSALLQNKAWSCFIFIHDTYNQLKCI